MVRRQVGQQIGERQAAAVPPVGGPIVVGPVVVGPVVVGPVVVGPVVVGPVVVGVRLGCRRGRRGRDGAPAGRGHRVEDPQQEAGTDRGHGEPTTRGAVGVLVPGEGGPAPRLGLLAAKQNVLVGVDRALVRLDGGQGTTGGATQLLGVVTARLLDQKGLDGPVLVGADAGRELSEGADDHCRVPGGEESLLEGRGSRPRPGDHVLVGDHPCVGVRTGVVTSFGGGRFAGSFAGSVAGARRSQLPGQRHLPGGVGAGGGGLPRGPCLGAGEARPGRDPAPVRVRQQRELQRLQTPQRPLDLHDHRGGPVRVDPRHSAVQPVQHPVQLLHPVGQVDARGRRGRVSGHGTSIDRTRVRVKR